MFPVEIAVFPWGRFVACLGLRRTAGCGNLPHEGIASGGSRLRTRDPPAGQL